MSSIEESPTSTNSVLCKYCHTSKTVKWWKCCPTHTPENTTEVVCHGCALILHVDSNPILPETSSIAARDPRGMFGLPDIRYEDVINIIDWNRVLIQAQGLHAKAHQHSDFRAVCGKCIKTILLRNEGDE
jgi:hypothetical protein